MVLPPRSALLGYLLVLTTMTTQQEREACHIRFVRAVRDGRKGDYAKAKELVERVRSESGDEVAERTKKELWAYMRSGKHA